MLGVLVLDVFLSNSLVLRVFSMALKMFFRRFAVGVVAHPKVTQVFHANGR